MAAGTTQRRTRKAAPRFTPDRHPFRPLLGTMPGRGRVLSAHIIAMETPINPGTIESVTDLVMKRQLVEVPRDHARGIVSMVLECAADVAGPVEAAYQPRTRRINVTVKDVSLENYGGYCDRVHYVSGWDGEAGERSNAYGPPRNDAAPTALTAELRGLIGRNVALWVTDDEFFPLPTIVQFNDMGHSAE